MLLDEHGGQLDIESAPGKGTRITVTLHHKLKDPVS
jgi:signal transduction histidine kinase